MAGGTNKVILCGNLTRDPEVRYTQSGTAYAKFGMAVNRKYKDQEETCFVDLTAWGKQAEILGEYCQKGRQLLVVGRLDYQTWEDKKGGGTRHKLEVVVEEFQLLGGRGDDGKANKPARSRRPEPVNADDDDIPF